MRRFAPNPDFNEIAKRGTVDVAGEGDTLINSFKLIGTLPGVGGACGWENTESVCPEGDGVVLFRMDSLQTDRSRPYYIITIDIFCSDADLHLSLGLRPVLR